VSDITTDYCPSGNPLIELTNMRDDQLYESWVYDDLFGWTGIEFPIIKGRGYEMVTIIDTSWLPTLYTNRTGIILANSQKKPDIATFPGSETNVNRTPTWLLVDKIYRPTSALNPAEKITLNPTDKEGPDNMLPNKKFTTTAHKTSHMVLAYVKIPKADRIAFTAYRLKKPEDVLTEKMVGCGISRKDDLSLIWFNAGNFRQAWKDGETVILIVEANHNGRGLYKSLKFKLQQSSGPQRLKPIELSPIPAVEPATALAAAHWQPLNDELVIGYSIYKDNDRLNNELIEKPEYCANGILNLKPIFAGGYETVYGSYVTQSETPISAPLIAYAFKISPNPFLSKTTVTFALPYPTEVDIRIFDVSGRVVKKLVSGRLNSGYYDLVWSGQDNKGRIIPAGIYFVQITTGDFNAQEKVIFVR
jgi:hypothetical protein